MNKLFLGSSLLLLALAGAPLFAQDPPPPRPIQESTAKSLEKKLAAAGPVSRENREQAYAKLLEAQRYILSIQRSRTESGSSAGARLAYSSLVKALEFDPTLSEAYTALAELTLSMPPNDMDEAVILAKLGVKTNPDNFGSRRILARIYTIKSRLTGQFDRVNAENAVLSWKEIARLDPKNAESYAFLAELYNKLNKQEERIASLKLWLAATTPIDARFYRSVMGSSETLSADNASMKLGGALVRAGRGDEAVEILGRVVADDPDNVEAVDLLKQAIDDSPGKTDQKTLELLQQANFASPNNPSLVQLLASVQSKLGKKDDAAKTLSGAIQKLLDIDRAAAAGLQLTLGDLYIESKKNEDAINAYEKALKLYGVGDVIATEEQREFAIRVFDKIIKVYRDSGRLAEAKATIERARLLLGKNDLFADKSLISLYRQTGSRDEALKMVKSLRAANGSDYGLIRMEALLLTESGRVDEGAALIKGLMVKGTVPSPQFDDFSNYLFLSSLYSQARRPKDAILSAQKALAAARDDETRQLAVIELANAQHKSGDHAAAERALREILDRTPENPIALNNLGFFLLQRDSDPKVALELIKKAVSIDPTNPAYLDSLGWAYLKTGDFEKAERFLMKAVFLDPSSTSILEHLGDLYSRQGRIELARDAWEKAIKLFSDSADVNRIKTKMAAR